MHILNCLSCKWRRRRLLCLLLTAHSSRQQTPTAAAVVRLPDGLSCPLDRDRKAQLHVQLWVHYRWTLLPFPISPTSKFNHPSCHFSLVQQLLFLTLSNPLLFLNCCPYGNPSVSNDSLWGGWSMERPLLSAGFLHKTVPWNGLWMKRGLSWMSLHQSVQLYLNKTLHTL